MDCATPCIPCIPRLGLQSGEPGHMGIKLREEINDDDDDVARNHQQILNIVHVSQYEGTTGKKDPNPEDDENPQKVDIAAGEIVKKL